MNTPVLDNFGTDMTRAAEEGKTGSCSWPGEGNRATGTNIEPPQEEQPYFDWRTGSRQICHC